MTKCFDWLARILTVVMAVMLAVMFVATAGEVLSRHIFNYSISTAGEIALFNFVWVVFLGSALLVRSNGHAAIEIIVDHLPERLHRLVAFLGQLASLFFFGVLVWHGLKLSIRSAAHFSSALELPMIYVYLAIPVGGFLMMLFMIEHMLKTNDRSSGIVSD